MRVATASATLPKELASALKFPPDSLPANLIAWTVRSHHKPETVPTVLRIPQRRASSAHSAALTPSAQSEQTPGAYRQRLLSLASTLTASADLRRRAVQTTNVSQAIAGRQQEPA